MVTKLYHLLALIGFQVTSLCHLNFFLVHCSKLFTLLGMELLIPSYVFFRDLRHTVKLWQECLFRVSSSLNAEEFSF